MHAAQRHHDHRREGPLTHPPDPLTAAVHAWIGAAGPPTDALAAFVAALAAKVGLDAALVDPPVGPDGPSAAAVAAVTVPPEVLAWAEAHPGGPPVAVGAVHELVRAATDRRRSGAVYTPIDVARRLVRLGLELVGVDPDDVTGADVTVCDPAAGGGVFLVAAAAALVAGGMDDTAAVAHVTGSDVDPVAVAVARAALLLWLAARRRVTPADAAVVRARVVQADALGPDVALPGRSRPATGARGPVLVVGNPPFLGQLRADTARSRADAAALRARFGAAAGPYTDTAGLFLLAGLDACGPGGAVLLILPRSMLVARDARVLREEVLARADLRALWLGGRGVFAAAAVDVVGVGLVRRPDSAPGPPGGGTVRRWRGRDVEPVAPLDLHAVALADAPTWGLLGADLHGVPPLPGGLRSAGCLADMAVATAGFRDEYYDLVPHVVEATDGPTRPRLVTVGAIDLAHLRWGREPTRFARRNWARPVVELAGIDPASALGAWGRQRLVPKVVVATQTRVLEGIVDPDGSLWPSTPAIALTPRPDWVPPEGTSRRAEVLHLLAAAALSPHATAWALTMYPGAALVGDAIKLAAWQVLSTPLPLPGASDAWAGGAAALAAAHAAAAAGDGHRWRSHLRAFGEAMSEAYGDPTPEAVLEWWWRRLPAWRDSRPTPRGRVGQR